MKIKVGDAIYEFPEGDLTGREAAYLKSKAGVRLGEIAEAVEAGDWDVVLCMAVIAAGRSGQQLDYEQLLDRPVGEVGLVGEEDEDPPTQAPSDGASDGTTGSTTPDDDGPSPTPTTSD